MSAETRMENLVGDIAEIVTSYVGQGSHRAMSANVADTINAAGYVSPETLEAAEDRAHAAEQSLGEADAEIERLKAIVARVEALESAWRERPARDNARWELGQALGPKS